MPVGVLTYLAWSNGKWMRKMLNKQNEILNKHTQILNKQTEMLEKISEMIYKIDETLKVMEKMQRKDIRNIGTYKIFKIKKKL